MKLQKIKLEKINKHLIVALVALLVVVLAILSVKVIKDQSEGFLEGGDPADPTDYFTGFSSSEMEFKDGYFSVLVKGDTEVKKQPENEDEIYSELVEVKKYELGIVNQLAVNDFEMVMAIPNNIDRMAIRFICSAYYETGNVGAVENEGDLYSEENATDDVKYVAEQVDENSGCILGADVPMRSFEA
jgi:hypothetical protein